MTKFRFVAVAAAFGALGSLAFSPPASAIGCISGGAAGAVAGHLAHHGVLGAIGGCVAGHEAHKYSKRRESEAAQQQQYPQQQYPQQQYRQSQYPQTEPQGTGAGGSSRY